MAKNESTRSDVKKKLQAQLKKSEQKAISEMKKAKKHFYAAEKQVKAYIKKNPVQSALIATTVASAIATAVSFALKKKK